MTLQSQGDRILPLLPRDYSEEERTRFDREILEYLQLVQKTTRIDFESIYGEICVKDAGTVHELSSAGHTQIISFSDDSGVNGLYNGVSPDVTNDHIVINSKGLYFVSVSISAGNDDTQAHIIHVELKKNNGDTDFDNVHAHRQLTRGVGDRGSISLSGIIEANVGDTLELWAISDSGAARGVIFEDITFTVIKVKR